MTGPVRPYFIDSGGATSLTGGIATGHEARALCPERAVDHLLDPATTGVDDDPDAVPLLGAHRGEVDPGVRDRLLAGGHREVDEPAHPPGHLRVHRARRVEVEDLRRDLHLEPLDVEPLDPPGPRHGALEVGPVGLEVVADRHHRAETRQITSGTVVAGASGGRESTRL
jgi:hypothetical protein